MNFNVYKTINTLRSSFYKGAALALLKEGRIDRAIENFHYGLERITKNDHAENWFDLSINLGIAYLSRATLSRDNTQQDDFNEAVNLFVMVLAQPEVEYLPFIKSTVRNLLGEAFRLSGEIEKSIEQYESAIRLFSETGSTDNVSLLADMYENLGKAYSKRIIGERVENLEIAISNFMKAEKIFSSQNNIEALSKLSKNLSLAYAERAIIEPEENINDDTELALAYYQLSNISLEGSKTEFDSKNAKDAILRIIDDANKPQEKDVLEQVSEFLAQYPTNDSEHASIFLNAESESRANNDQVTDYLMSENINDGLLSKSGDATSRYDSGVPVFNEGLSVKGDVVINGPMIVNSGTKIDGALVINAIPVTDRKNTEFTKKPNLSIGSQAMGDIATSDVAFRSGPAEVLASGTIIAFDNNPIEIIIKQGSIRLVFAFANEANSQTVRAKVVGENTIELTFFKAQDQFTQVGTIRPLPIGKWQNQQLFLHCRLREFLDGDFTVDFGLYLVGGTSK